MELDNHIRELFNNCWVGEHTLSSLDNMKDQLAKNLKDQLNGYWSGSTAYHIMTRGGFLIDSKRGTKKELTVIGGKFMKEMATDTES